MIRTEPARGEIRMGRTKAVILCLTALMVLISSLCAGAETAEPVFGSYLEALDYIRENRPSELTLREVNWDPRYLLLLLDEMGEGTVLHFRSSCYGTVITDGDETINLNYAKWITVEDIENLIRLCPNVKSIILTTHFYLRNQPMEELSAKYPEINFVWQVTLRAHRNLSTDDTAYSAFSGQSQPDKIISEDLEALKYVKHLKALDLGHSQITSLDWLQYCPELELLILGDNLGITDLTPVGNLKHLQYLEIFSTGITDLSPLANCTELIDLNLSYCNNVTDLSPLDGLKLERFWGNQMEGLTEEEIFRFLAVHPDTECMFYGEHATSETWRMHNRYWHYMWCFETRQWIPFSEPIPGVDVN